MPITRQPDAVRHAKPDPWLGRVLVDRYEVHALLSSGGMGKVYRGVQRALERPVAIKRVHPHLLSVPGMVGRFMEEARLVSRLSHPNIVKVFDFGRTAPESGGDLFLVMELIEGIDLATLLTTQPTAPFSWSVEVLREVLSALEEAHAHSVVHRDVKPENVIITPTRSGKVALKLIDFGIAKVHGGTGWSAADEAVGTPEYMAPEQARGEAVGPATDLYALGVLMFRMLTGRPPFSGRNAHEILRRQLDEARPDPREFAPERNIPEALATICTKAIALDPRERFEHADHFADALRAAVGQTAAVTRVGRYPARAAGAATTKTLPSRPDPAETSSGARSDRYSIVHKRTDFAALHRLDLQIAAATAAGDNDAVLVHVTDGVERARLLTEQGDVELASVAWVSFGGRLIAELRRAGHHGRADALLEEALRHVRGDDEARTALGEKRAAIAPLTLDLDGLEAEPDEAPETEKNPAGRDASGIHFATLAPKGGLSKRHGSR